MHRMALVLVAVVAVGCDRKPDPASSSATTSADTSSSAAALNMPPLPHGHGMMSPPAADEGAAAISWTDPPAWKRNQPANAMRKAEYAVPHVGKDTEDAECVVYNFGAGQGGAVQANLDRWKQQMVAVAGGEPKTTTSTVSGMNVTTLEMAGTTKPSAMMGAPAPAKTNQRMVGVVVEAPGGPWFFKLTGPDATVKDAAPAFKTMIESIKKKG